MGDLKPGESRKLELPLVANRPGPATNLLTARGDGNLRAEDKLDLEVLAPQLDVAVEGPKRRYLERQATYQLSVTNPGTAPAKQVELVANLPPGLKFVSANNAGYYEESTRTVRWRLEELPANETGSVELVTMPVEAGQQAIKLRGTAQKGLTRREGAAGGDRRHRGHSLPGGRHGRSDRGGRRDDLRGPRGQSGLEGGEPTCGWRSILPPELKPVAAEGPTRHRVDGNRVLFDGLARLAPKADTTYRVRVKGLKARRSPRPLPTADRRHAKPGHEGREHAGVRGRVMGVRGNCISLLPRHVGFLRLLRWRRSALPLLVLASGGKGRQRGQAHILTSMGCLGKIHAMPRTATIACGAVVALTKTLRRRTTRRILPNICACPLYLFAGGWRSCRPARRAASSS